MDLRELRARADALRKTGVRGAELLFEHTAGQRWTVQRGRAVRLDRPETAQLTVRVWTDDGRCGASSGPPGQVDALADAAIMAASRAEPDPHGGPVARQSTVLGGLGILDRRYEVLEDADRDEVIATAEKSVKATDRRVSPSAFEYADQLRVRRFVNTRGVALEETDTTYRASGVAASLAGTEEVVIHGGIESRTFASIASLPYGTDLAQRVVELLRPSVRLEGPVRVVLPPLATATLFAALADRFAAEQFEGEGWFLRPRADGKPAVDPRLHVQDDGAMPGGLRTRSFDDRGVASVALTLLREGRVDGRFVDPELAHRRDVRPTGHTWGGRQRPSNLILRAGTRSLSAALADLGGTTLWVDDLPDLARGLDFATGRLDLPIYGVVKEGNKAVGAVRKRRLTGDLGAALNRLVEVCSDTDRVAHVDAPGVILDGLALT